MCITKTQICELNNIIDKLNSMDSEEERDQYLRDSVEDVELFLDTLRKINKNKLKTGKKKKCTDNKEKNLQYQKEEVRDIFQQNSVDDIMDRYSKAQLTAMYHAVYSAKPLAADNKERIAYAVKGYFHDMSRARALLG